MGEGSLSRYLLLILQCSCFRTDYQSSCIYGNKIDLLALFLLCLGSRL